MEFRLIRASDIAWHARFFDFVGTIFPGIGNACWHAWRDRGGWTDDYEVFAMVEGERIVSAIGRNRMRLVCGGETREGYQLSAVGTLASHRMQGLSRLLMPRVITAREATDQPIILFANSGVTGFYPRFGFVRTPQRTSTARVAIRPSGTRATQCDPADARDRARLAALCARAQPTRGPLTARDYFPILLWHLTCRPIALFWLPAYDAAIAATEAEGRLILHDVIGAQQFDLAPAIPALIMRDVNVLAFGFDPEGWWSAAEHGAFDDAKSPLFVLGGTTTIDRPVQFPELAHT